MSFENIIGQDRVIKILNNAISSKKIANTFIFSGSPSIGKKQTAVEFAKILNCENQNKGKSCGICKNCKKIEHGTHPELKIYNLENKNISIDTVKEIQHEMQYKNTESIYRVIIIDNADKFTQEAANCFLKTLEEPPLGTIIILITTSASNLMKTIISRCQTLKFKDLTLDEKIKILEQNSSQDTEILKNALLLSGNIISEALLFLENDENKETVNKFIKLKAIMSSGNLSIKQQKELEDLAKDKDLVNKFLGFVINSINFSEETDSKFLEIMLLAKKYFDRNVNPKLILIWLYLKACEGYK